MGIGSLAFQIPIYSLNCQRRFPLDKATSLKLQEIYDKFFRNFQHYG